MRGPTVTGEPEEAMSEQVSDLRERMKLLQGDRRANVEMLESNKKANKDEMKRLRGEIKGLRARLAHRETVPAMVEHKARKRYDQAREVCLSKEAQLKKLMDRARELELESAPVATEDSAATRTIRMLENRLDKALIKFNEAQSIKKTYEQIVQRLREERVGFDHQLEALERTFAAKQRDFEELQLLAGDANHSREFAQAELEQIRAGYEEERKRRDKELRNRHQTVQLRKQTLDRFEKRYHMRHDIAVQEQGHYDSLGRYHNLDESNADRRNLHDDDDDDDDDTGGRRCGKTSKGGGGALTRNGPREKVPETASSEMALVALSKERVEQRTKIDVFEQAFRKIKDATGVSDVNEVIQKITGQESTTENLMALTQENQHKIEALNEQKRRIKVHLEDVKYSGQGSGCGRKTVDDAEDRVAQAQARFDRDRAKYERLAKMLIAAKAGVKHLQDKLDGVRDDLPRGTFSAALASASSANADKMKQLGLYDQTLVNFMAENEKMMVELLTRIAFARDDLMYASPPSNSSAAATNTQIENSTTHNSNEADLMRMRPYNQRIQLPALEEWAADGAGPAKTDADLLSGGDIDDELTRDQVKRASSQLLLAQDKFKRKHYTKQRGLKSPQRSTS